MENLICILGPLVKGLITAIKKIKCSGDVAICAPHNSGKSYFINSVSSKNYALLDLEENVALHLTEQEKQLLNSLNNDNSSRNLHYFPLCKKYLLDIKKNHKGKKLIVFSSNYELLEYCNLKNIISFIPSNVLAENIKLNLNEEKKKEFENNRVELMLKAGNKMISFNNFDDMGNFIINKFKLQRKL